MITTYNETRLSPTLTLRPAQWADIKPIAGLILDVCTADVDQIAGYSLCRSRSGIGWVGTLGVRRAWRKRGLGEALLLHSSGEFYKRGTKTIGLGVDAENPTGATRLYRKAGMKVAAEYVIYEKELRAGREPEEQE